MSVLEWVLVNDMPDGAFLQAERQFTRLVEAGAAGAAVHVRRYTFGGRARSRQVADHIGRHYRPLAQLWSTGADAVVVTGAEPEAAALADEPTWPELTRLLDWVVERAGTALLSCQSAHAAVRHFDGIDRVPLAAKCSGIFPHLVAPHPLTRGLPAEVPLPHSRCNTVPSTALAARGHRVLVTSGEADWAVALAEYGGRPVMLVQSHPEYDADTLLREYRRDVGRFRRGERLTRPVLPAGYLDLIEGTSIDGWQRGELPFDELARRLRAPWAGPAARLYANWLAGALHHSVPTKAS